jgi:hypothetical protein
MNLIIVSRIPGHLCLYYVSHIRLTTLTGQLGNYSSRRTTRLATTQLKYALNTRNISAPKDAAGHPSLYTLSPHGLPSSRTPLVTPHRAPTRHQPRQSTVNTRNSHHSRSATTSRGKPKLVPVKAVSGVLHRGKSHCYRRRYPRCLRRHGRMRKSRWLMADCGERRAGLGSLRRRDRCSQ